MEREERVRPVRNKCSMQRLGKRLGFFALDIKEIPVKEFLCKVLMLVSRVEREIHGKFSVVEGFEGKLVIHGYNWNDLDSENE